MILDRPDTHILDIPALLTDSAGCGSRKSWTDLQDWRPDTFSTPSNQSNKQQHEYNPPLASHNSSRVSCSLPLVHTEASSSLPGCGLRSSKQQLYQRSTLSQTCIVRYSTVAAELHKAIKQPERRTWQRLFCSGRVVCVSAQQKKPNSWIKPVIKKLFIS